MLSVAGFSNIPLRFPLGSGFILRGFYPGYTPGFSGIRNINPADVRRCRILNYCHIKRSPGSGPMVDHLSDINVNIGALTACIPDSAVLSELSTTGCWYEDQACLMCTLMTLMLITHLRDPHTGSSDTSLCTFINNPQRAGRPLFTVVHTSPHPWEQSYHRCAHFSSPMGEGLSPLCTSPSSYGPEGHYQQFSPLPRVLRDIINSSLPSPLGS